MPISLTLTGIQLGTPGYEIALLYLACLTALVLGGTGRLALDMLFAKRPAWDKARVETPVAIVGPQVFVIRRSSLSFGSVSSKFVSSDVILVDAGCEKHFPDLRNHTWWARRLNITLAVSIPGPNCRCAMGMNQFVEKTLSAPRGQVSESLT